MRKHHTNAYQLKMRVAQKLGNTKKDADISMIVKNSHDDQRMISPRKIDLPQKDLA